MGDVSGDLATRQSWVWIPKRWVVLKALAVWRKCSIGTSVRNVLSRVGWPAEIPERLSIPKCMAIKFLIVSTLSTLSLTWFCCWKSQVSFLITLLVCSFIKFMSVATSVISFIRCSLLPLMCLADVLLLTSCALTVNIASRSVFYELMYPADFWILFSQQCLFIVLESSVPTQILFILFFLPLLVQFPMFPSQQEVSCWKHREQSRRDHVYGFCVQSILFLYRNGTCWVLFLYQIYWCWFLVPSQINYYLYLLEKTGFLFLKNIDFFYR